MAEDSDKDWGAGALMAGVLALLMALGATLWWRFSEAKARARAAMVQAEADDARERAHAARDAVELAPPPSSPPSAASDETQRRAPGADPLTSVVFGTLRDTLGATLEGAGVTLHDADGRWVKAETSTDGYRASGLAPGDWWVDAWSERGRPARARVAGLGAGEERRVDLVAEARVVLEVVALTPAGEPLRLAPFPDAHAALRASRPRSSFNELVPVATLEPLGERFLWRVGAGGNSFGVGRFTAADKERDPPALLGRLALEVEPPVHVALTAYQGVLASQLVPAGVERVSFVLGAEDLAARSAGLRFVLAGVSPGLESSSPPLGPQLVGPGTFDQQLELVSGPNEWLGLPPGEYALWWLAHGVQRSFVLTAGETLDLGTLNVEEPRTFRARLRLPDGSTPELAGEEPWFAFAIEDARGGRIDDTYRLGAGEGDELSLALQPGRYTLQWHGERLASAPFALDLRERDAAFDVTVFPLAPLVLVPPPDAPSAYFRILQQGVEVGRARFAGPWPLRLELVPGPLEVERVDASGFALATRSLVLAPEGARLEL